jgi:hypothetical protein
MNGWRQADESRKTDGWIDEGRTMCERKKHEQADGGTEADKWWGSEVVV